MSGGSFADVEAAVDREGRAEADGSLKKAEAEVVCGCGGCHLCLRLCRHET